MKILVIDSFKYMIWMKEIMASLGEKKDVINRFE